MSLDIQLIQPEEIKLLQEFEQKKLAELIHDEDERRLQSWHARWRQESLEHYINISWSFAAKEDDKILGYFLAQPLLFFDGFTQSIWVEHLEFINLQVRDFLCEFLYKMAREKHFQKVYFPKESTYHGGMMNALAPYKPEVWAPSTLQVKTVKL
jgi:hypothetical protein